MELGPTCSWLLMMSSMSPRARFLFESRSFSEGDLFLFPTILLVAFLLNLSEGPLRLWKSLIDILYSVPSGEDTICPMLDELMGGQIVISFMSLCDSTSSSVVFGLTFFRNTFLLATGVTW